MSNIEDVKYMGYAIRLIKPDTTNDNSIKYVYNDDENDKPKDGSFGNKEFGEYNVNRIHFFSNKKEAKKCATVWKKTPVFKDWDINVCEVEVTTNIINAY